MNGGHKGLYFISEKIREEKGKIELGDEDMEGHGDFLLESWPQLTSNYPNIRLPDVIFTSNYLYKTGVSPYECILSWEVKYPDEDSINKQAVDRIKSRIEEYERILLAEETEDTIKKELIVISLI